jgi:uncharacterized C2H2 Zn-finger protein
VVVAAERGKGIEMGLTVVRMSPGEPKFRCLVCQAVFYEGEHRAYERHVVGCAQRNEAELRAMSLRERAPALFDPERSGDVELGKWIRLHRTELLEGRKKL